MMAIPNSKIAGNRSITMLADAEKKGYAVLTVCCYSFEEIVATVRAAETLKSPAVIALFPWALDQFGPHLASFAARIARSAAVPITLHLDHCQSPETVRYAASLPETFDSIMADMSHFEWDENLKLTADLVQVCHAAGIAVEAEPGRIEGGEDGVADTADLESVLTTPEQMEQLVRRTGIDFLAPSFGNVHGRYGPKGPRSFLRLDRLTELGKAVREMKGGEAVRFVLHGSGEFDEDLYRECVAKGLRRVNVNVQLVEPWRQMMERRVKFTPMTALIEDSINLFQKEIEMLMRIVGSTGRA